MSKKVATFLIVSLVLSAAQCFAQNANTGVNVGPGWAGANASANGSIWQFTDTTSKVKNGTSLGQGLAIGVGHNGISFSHSIGANGGGVGVGHNLNMTIGRNGTHVSHGGVTTQGGNSQVVVGGGSGQYGNRIYGGSQATGYGNNTRVYSNSHTRQFPRVFFR